MPAAEDSNEIRRRLMGAATELLRESRGLDASVGEISKLAKVSTKTFYRHYADKDEFFFEFWMQRLVAVSERVSARAYAQTDPVDRLREFSRALFASNNAATASRGTAVYHARLAQSAPDKVALAHRPLYELLVRLIEDAQQAGRIEAGDPTRLATPMLELLSVSVRDQRTGSAVTPTPPALEDVVQFCLRGLGV